jgi:hypothetical protein
METRNPPKYVFTCIFSYNLPRIPRCLGTRCERCSLIKQLHQNEWVQTSLQGARCPWTHDTFFMHVFNNQSDVFANYQLCHVSVVYFLFQKKNFQLGPPTLSLASGASSAGGGCVESCTRQIYWDPIGFRIRWCGFRLVSFDLRLSSLAMVAVLVRLSLGPLTRRLTIYLLQQDLLR